MQTASPTPLQVGSVLPVQHWELLWMIACAFHVLCLHLLVFLNFPPMMRGVHCRPFAGMHVICVQSTHREEIFVNRVEFFIINCHTVLYACTSW